MRNRIIALALCAGILLLGGCASDGTAGTSGGTTNNGQESNSPSASGQVAADTRTSFEKLFDDGPLLVQSSDGLWGYIDSTGSYVIKPQYPDAYEFQANGLAAVKDSSTGLWGYINTSGEYAIEPAFSRISPSGFADNGLAAVFDAETDLGGYINESGEYVIQPTHYYALGDFSDGLAVAGTTGYQYYLDESGKVQFSLNFQEAYNLVDGWAVVNHRGLPGYINRDGEHRIFTDVKDVYGFDNGRAFVELHSGKYKVIDENLECVSDMEFDDVLISNSRGGGKGAARWSDGLCIVGIETPLDGGGSYVYDYAINTDGEIVFPDDGQLFLTITNFTNGYAVAQDAESQKYGIIDTSGAWTVPPQYDSIGAPTADGIYLVGDMGLADGKFINQNGEVILECVNPDVQFFGSYRDLIQVKILDENHDTIYEHFSYVNHDGDLITDLFFDETSNFSLDSSYAQVKYNGFWGIIDGEGNWLIESQFRQIGR